MSRCAVYIVEVEGDGAQYLIQLLKYWYQELLISVVTVYQQGTLFWQQTHDTNTCHLGRH